MEHFKSSSINFGPKWVARVRQLALRSQSPVVIYKKEYYSSSNQTQILKLSIRRRQSNLIIVFTFCSLRRKKLLSCRFGRIAQFHCHSYCKHSHRRCQSTSFFSHFSFPIFELGGMTKHLMTAPSGNSDPTTVGRFFSFLSPSFSPSPPPPPPFADSAYVQIVSTNGKALEATGGEHGFVKFFGYEFSTQQQGHTHDTLHR